MLCGGATGRDLTGSDVDSHVTGRRQSRDRNRPWPEVTEVISYTCTTESCAMPLGGLFTGSDGSHVNGSDARGSMLCACPAFPRHFRWKGSTRGIAQLSVVHAHAITSVTSLPVTWLTSLPVAPPHSTSANVTLSVPIYFWSIYGKSSVTITLVIPIL